MSEHLPSSYTSDCFFCGAGLPTLDLERLPQRERIAYDPGLGRLWRVCGQCLRWNVVPLEDRWEVLDDCERLARDIGDLLLTTSHLALFSVSHGQLVRVGAPPRADLADWRYSVRLDDFPVRRSGWLDRLLRLPEMPVENMQRPAWDAYHRTASGVSRTWVAAAFAEHGALLTRLLMDVPLAETCPSCGQPFLVLAQCFGDTQLLLARSEPVIVARCGLCGEQGEVSLAAARPALRAGVAIVERDHRATAAVQAAVAPIERIGSAGGFVQRLARRELDLGSMADRDRLALWICLDEQAEAEALEAEWRLAEELESIYDRELSEVPGFDEFRARAVRHGDPG